MKSQYGQMKQRDKLEPIMLNIYNNMINNGGIIGALSESNIEDEKYYVKKYI